MRIELELEVVTPLIMSGADRGDFELREMSINGAMRYWYRKFYGIGDGSEERKIFGSTGERGKFNLRVRSNSDSLNVRRLGEIAKEQGIRYLAFRSISRKARIPPSRFNLIFDISDKLSNEEIKKLVGSLWAAIYIGGMGTRSRRGFGSLKVIDLIHNITSEDIVEPLLPRFADVNKRIRGCKDHFGFTNQIEFINFNIEDFDFDRFFSNSFQDFYCKAKRKIEEYIEKYMKRSGEKDYVYYLNIIGCILMYYRACMEPDYSIAKKFYKEFENNNYRLRREKREELEKVVELFKRADFGLPISFKFSQKKGSKPLVLGNRKPSQLFIRLYNFDRFYSAFYIYRFKGTRKESVLEEFIRSVQKSAKKHERR